MINKLKLPVRIRDSVALSPTLRRFSLESVDASRLPPAPPGAHILLRLEAHGRQWKNAYSVVSSSRRGDVYEIIVRKAPASRGGSSHIHEHSRPGDVLEMVPPVNQFALSALARKHLLIGGGVGVTPLLSFLPALRDMGADFELHQFSTKRESDVFRSLLAPDGTHVHVHPGRHSANLSVIMARQPLGTHLYVCGPTALMSAVEATAAGAGWPATNVHSENFGGAGGEPFTVVLRRSGVAIQINPDETLLEALEAANVVAPSLCRGGACGECVAVVLEGVPDHRDHFLTPEERESGKLILTCVSRAKTPGLVLDL